MQKKCKGRTFPANFPHCGKLSRKWDLNILHALDSQVLCTLLECIHDRRAADITVYSRRYGTMRTHTVYPAKIYVSTQDGRQYLLCYHYRYRKPMFFRLDTVHEVTAGSPEKKTSGSVCRTR